MNTERPKMRMAALTPCITIWSLVKQRRQASNRFRSAWDSRDWERNGSKYTILSNNTSKHYPSHYSHDLFHMSCADVLCDTTKYYKCSCLERWVVLKSKFLAQTNPDIHPLAVENIFATSLETKYNMLLKTIKYPIIYTVIQWILH